MLTTNSRKLAVTRSVNSQNAQRPSLFPSRTRLFHSSFTSLRLTSIPIFESNPKPNSSLPSDPMEVARITPPAKDPHANRSKLSETPKSSENSNPNMPHSTPPSKHSSSPLTKSRKPAPRNQTVNASNPAVFSPRNKIRERKFVFAKKVSKKEKPNSKAGVDCKCKDKSGGHKKKCICAAYESLRASQEDFLKSKQQIMEDLGPESGDCCDKDEDDGVLTGSPEIEHPVDTGNSGEKRTSIIKRRRERMLAEARNSVPECGKVLHLVKAFEKLLTVPGSKESEKLVDEEPEESKKPVGWALPGLQQPKEPHPETDTQVSSSSFCPSDFMLTAENLGLDPHLAPSSSWDSSRGSASSRSSNGGRRSRRNSTDSVGTVGGRRWKKNQLKRITSQKPFKLITEQRGRVKEEEFVKKVQEMMLEQERQRIPIAQGLPWTTDEPEVLIKPPAKEITKAVDLRLHSDQRAAERAEFDHQVYEKLSLIEQYKMEREMQKKMEEEEETRRLRKELVPKAQPMPYFDRPFIPKRSVKHPTIPKEPRFHHIPNHKKMKCCLSWNDMSSFTLQDQSH